MIQIKAQILLSFFINGVKLHYPEGKGILKPRIKSKQEREHLAKETEKFYFKPPLQLPKEGELISQLYGNISLEKIRINHQPSYFKLLASVYSDRLYYDAKPFDELMDRLFERT